MFESEICWSILNALESSGQYQSHPAVSCAAVLLYDPFSPSGHYWVRSSNGSAVRVYCDMTRSCGDITGGWMRVVELDMTNESTQCPSGLRQHDNNLRTCRINSDSRLSCSSVTFNLNGIRYSSVYGVIRAYGCGTPDGDNDLIHGINSNYVDGISLTYGMNPRQHIWTFAIAHSGCWNSPSLILYTMIIIVAISIDHHHAIPISKIFNGMEVSVVLKTNAVPSTILHSFTSSYHSSPLMILR